MSNHISRRFAAFAGAGALAAVAVLGVANPALASQPVGGSHKVGYCHATHSKTNPYVYIETDKVAVIRAHQKHQNDEDAIPEFTYLLNGVETRFEGKNLGLLSECGLGLIEG